jgi:RNA polymerase sigma-70 factor (ECF subfamily)
VHRDQVETLFARYREPVYRFLRRLLRDGAAAEDLTQDTFVRALGAAYHSEGRERGWVFQIARNLARDHARVGARQPARVEVQEAVAPAPDHQLSLEIEAALALLTDADREIFLLREVAGLSYAEIAEVCGVTPGAVRSRIHRARLALRAALSPAEHGR